MDLIVAVERAGPGVDGSYYTMRGLKMDDVVSPLERLLTHAPRAWSIGVGDGGNEVGMAKVTGTQTHRHSHGSWLIDSLEARPSRVLRRALSKPNCMPLFVLHMSGAGCAAVVQYS